MDGAAARSRSASQNEGGRDPAGDAPVAPRGSVAGPGQRRRGVTARGAAGVEPGSWRGKPPPHASRSTDPAGPAAPEVPTGERAVHPGRRSLLPQSQSVSQARMAPPLVLVLALALLPPLVLPEASPPGGKYSRAANEGEDRRPPAAASEFRIVRLNQVWEKAQRLPLSAVRLAELHSDLKLQEKDELAWKKLKADGMDADGEREALLRRRLHVIMAKYGMNGKKDAHLGDSNYVKDGLENDVLDDPRLEKLWNKAKTSGKFSEEELDKLWREFRHHKEKVHEYNILLETVSRTEDIQKNMVTSVEEEVPLKQELLHRKHAELKEKLHSINQGFERLRKLSHQGYDSTSEFDEPRVIDLWDLAKSTNFTEKELESLREELKHFEAKVEKHHHYQKQLEISHEKLKHVEGTGDQEHLSRNREKYTMLEEKTKELGYKVKKHLQDLSSRISRGLQHNEL